MLCINTHKYLSTDGCLQLTVCVYMSLYVCPAASCLPDFLLYRNTQALKTQTLPDRQRSRPPLHLPITHTCAHTPSLLFIPPSIHSLPLRQSVGWSISLRIALQHWKERKQEKEKNKRTRRRRRKITTFVPVIIWIVFFVCFLQRFQSVPLTCVRINHVGRLSSLRSFFYKYIYMIPFSHSLSSSSTSSSLLFSHPSSLVSNHSRSLFYTISL